MIPKRHVDFYGDQTRWFTGVVKSLNDPLQVARIQVRIHGIHSDSQVDIPDENLPWAQVVAPISAGGTSGLGNPLGIQVGALVFGIFLDGQHSQLPLVLGSIPKLEGQERDTPSVNALARGTNTVSHTPDPDTNEPSSPYAAEYPYNKVYQTESGNTIEIDDTPGAVRIHIRHASGTFVEMHPNGDVVTHHKNGFRTVTGNDKLHVTGDMNIIVDENLTISAKNMTTSISENMTTNVSENMTTTVDKTVTQFSDSYVATASSGDVRVDGVSLVNHTHSHTDTPGLGAGTRNTSTPNKG